MHLIPDGLCKVSRAYPVKDSNSTEKYVLQRRQVENGITIMGFVSNNQIRSVLSSTPMFIFNSKMVSYLCVFYLIQIHQKETLKHLTLKLKVLSYLMKTTFLVDTVFTWTSHFFFFYRIVCKPFSHKKLLL